ncbi:MAG: 2,3-bisphosphoglycerate-dependent phosphoglycerate mutase [Gammaproteobacteria bacterium]
MKLYVKLVLLRHGQSWSNKQRRFTGWSDVALTQAGERQARVAGELLAAAGFQFDEVYTSQLRRATDTLEIVLRAMRCVDLPIHRQWRLNERHYGALEGLGPLAAVVKFGLWQVIQCQRRIDVAPPLLDLDDPRFPGNQACFEEVPTAELPRAESKQQAWQRMQPIWKDEIAPALKAGRRLLVVSHKNTLRELIKQIVGKSGSRCKDLSIRTGRPIVFELTSDLELIRNYVAENSAVP